MLLGRRDVGSHRERDPLRRPDGNLADYRDHYFALRRRETTRDGSRGAELSTGIGSVSAVQRLSLIHI